MRSAASTVWLGVSCAAPFRTMPQPRLVPTTVSAAGAGWAQPLAQPEMCTASASRDGGRCRASSAASARAAISPGRAGRLAGAGDDAAARVVGAHDEAEPFGRVAAIGRPRRRSTAARGSRSAARPEHHGRRRGAPVAPACRHARVRRAGRRRARPSHRAADGGRSARPAGVGGSARCGIDGNGGTERVDPIIAQDIDGTRLAAVRRNHTEQTGDDLGSRSEVDRAERRCRGRIAAERHMQARRRHRAQSHVGR